MAAKKKLKYDMILTGKSERAMWRYRQKKANKGVLESPLGKMRPRQERKAMAKALKIAFTPRYNGVVWNVIRELVKDKKGRLKVAIKDIKEVK